MPTTLELAARLVPLPRAERDAVLARFPRDRGHVSQLAESFDGTWYLHRGDLTVDGDLDSTLNLVVDGDLTVRGTLSDDTQQALLVVTGDLLCHHLFSRQLLVVLGSLLATGLVYADYNDYAFEVWGEALHARALVLDDKSSLLPERRTVELEHDSDLAVTSGDASRTFPDDLLRFVDTGGNTLYRVEEDGVSFWVDDTGERLDEEDGRAVEVERTAPADFDTFLAAVRGGGRVFRSDEPAELDGPLVWRLERDTAPELVALHGASADPRLRVAAASHPQASSALLARLAADTDARVRAAVAHHPALPPGAAAALARDGDDDVRRQLAASPHGAAHLGSLVADPSAEVRRAAASHPALADEQRRTLISDPVRAVKGRALRYLPVTAAWVAELRGAADELQSAWAIEHEREVEGSAAAATDWWVGLLDARQAVREASLRSTRDPRLLPFLSEYRERFLVDASPLVRRALAMAARDPETLLSLSGDSDPYVRRFALDNLAAPEALLVAEAERLASAPAAAWGTSDPRYIDLMAATQSLLKHPRLPQAALRTIHRSFPLAYRLEPHRGMPLDVIFERAESLTASLAFDAGFRAWKETAAAANGDRGPILAAMLDADDSYLQAAARMSPAVPVEALLDHARGLAGDTYALEDISRNALLGAPHPATEELRRLLLEQSEHGVDSALAGNPDLPARVLRELLDRAPDEARRTLWQAHGEVP